MVLCMIGVDIEVESHLTMLNATTEMTLRRRNTAGMNAKDASATRRHYSRLTDPKILEMPSVEAMPPSVTFHVTALTLSYLVS